MDETRNPQELREFFSRQIAMDVPGINLSYGARGALVGALNKHLGGDEMRKLVLGWLFSGGQVRAMSSKELTDSQWNVLSDWVGMWHDEDVNEWRVRDGFTYEAAQVLTETVKAYMSLTNTQRAGLPNVSDQLQTAVGLGGTITLADSSDPIATPLFDKLVEQSKFGRLIHNRDTGIDDLI